MDAVEYMKQYAECDRKAKRSLAEYKAECEAIESMMPLPKNLRPGMDALVSYTETLKARAETSIRKRDEVLSMINRVPGIERDILVARHVDGLKCEDVAIKYHYSLAGMWKVYYRGVAILQAHLDEDIKAGTKAGTKNAHL